MQEDQPGVEKGTPATGHPEQGIFAVLQTLYRKTLKTHSLKYRKIPKISPGAYIFQRPFLEAYFWRGLSTEGNLRFKTDWASLIVGSKFTVFSLFYFVFEGNFPSTSPPGDLYSDRFGGLMFGGAYTWRGLFSEFYGISNSTKLGRQKFHN